MRIRITFSKTGALRYIGHLDLHKLWERTSRRAGLDLIYSQGFHPQPKIQLASALPLGFSSTCELIDMWINGEVDLEKLPEQLSKAVPPGLGIQKVEQVDEKSPPLQTQVVSSEYDVVLPKWINPGEVEEKISACLQADILSRERRGKAYDLRPLIEHLILGEEDDTQAHLYMRLTAREGATGRPEEVLDALGIPYEETRVQRTQLIFKE